VVGYDIVHNWSSDNASRMRHWSHYAGNLDLLCPKYNEEVLE